MKLKILVLTAVVCCLFPLFSVDAQPLPIGCKHGRGSPETSFARKLQVKPKAELSPKQLSVRLVSATRPRKVSLAGQGAVAGNWLVVVLRVTSPRDGFSVDAPALSGAGLPEAIEPHGITGDSAPKGDTWFLGYGKEPGIIENWGRLRQQNGAYFGAGYMGADGQLRFIVTSDRKLLLGKSGPVMVTLLFDIRGGQGPYVLHLGDASINVRR